MYLNFGQKRYFEKTKNSIDKQPFILFCVLSGIRLTPDEQRLHVFSDPNSLTNQNETYPG